MNLGRCPHCHLRIDLANLVSDDAASQVLRMVVALGDDARPLVAYVGLWRPAKNDLSWDRTLKLMTEVQAMLVGIDRQAACEALAATVQGIRDKGGKLPITSHGYLQKVVAGIERRPAAEGQALVVQKSSATSNDVEKQPRSGSPAPRSKTAQALETLERMKRPQS